MRRVFVYKLKPTAAQAEGLERYLRVTRDVYNAALEQRIVAYRQGISQSQYDQAREIKDLRVAGMLEGCHVHTVQETLKRLDLAYAAFFRRCAQGATRKGFPRFRGARHWRSFTFKAFGTGASLKNGRLRITNVGSVRIRLHRPLVGTLKTCTVVRKPDGWYAHIVCDVPDVLPVPDIDPSQRGAIDVGIVRLATLHTGEVVENTRPLQRASRSLRVEQRSLSRCSRGSRRRAKQRERLARAHLKVSRVRRDYLHKESRKLADRYTFVAVEDLKITAMSRSARGTSKNPGRNVRQKAGLNRSILDASWGEFVAMLTYKLEAKGGGVVRVDARYTSQTCPECGTVDRANRRSQAEFVCVSCGYEENADYVAAQNIYDRAWAAPVAEVACVRGR